MSDRFSGRVALRTAAAYALFSAIWIFASDTIVSRVVTDPVTMHRVELTKGWACVAVTSVLLYMLVSEQLRGRSAEAERRRRSEEQLLRISRAVEQSPASVVVTDRLGTIEYVNDKFTRVTGYSREEAVGQNPRLLKSGETPAEVYRDLWTTISQGGEWRGELHNRRKNGELFWEMVFISPITDADGTVTSFLAIKEDITERKLLEEQLRQSQKLEALGTLAGGVAHDFNNILTVILTGASIQLDPATSPDERLEMAEQIQQAGNRAAGLTRQLLLFSRKHTINRTSVNVSDLVMTLSKMLRRLLGEDIVLDTRCGGGLPLVAADAGMIEQVVLNLVVNARDAMPSGGRIVITTDALAGAVRIIVRDEGTGIPAEVRPHIFEPFFTTKGVGRGTGLGLSTAYGIVQQHHGTIDVESAPGVGTTFIVTLPQASVAPDAVHRVAARGLDGLPVGTETVMVVEDEASVRRMAADILKRCGYRVIEAASGDHAMQLWQARKFDIDLVFTDLVMPGEVNGVELNRRMCAVRPDQRVLFTSGYQGRHDQDGLDLEAGRNFLQKPFDAQQLATAVRQRLDRPI
jgi:two-component system NtrC family sensor kinase